MNRVAVLGIMAIIVGLVGCASSTAPTSSVRSIEPSGSAVVSVSSIDPGSQPIFQNRALATVRVNQLDVRSAPGASAPVLDDERGVFRSGGKVRLNAGDHVLVISSATSADGFWWLEIAADRVDIAGSITVGFVAAGTRSDPWVEQDNSWCPGEQPSLGALVALSEIERLGCYGSSPLSFTAYRFTVPPGIGFECPAGSLPEWLRCSYNWVSEGGANTSILLHFDPATGIAPTGGVTEGAVNPPLHITGHFDDPAAVGCPNPWSGIQDAAGSLWCATFFVVERVI